MDGLIQEFMEITGSSHSEATEYLNNNNKDIGDAVQDYYQSNESSSASSQQPRTPMNTSSTYSKKSERSGNNSNFKSFSQLMKESRGDGDDDDDEQRNTFAGGETSGLEIADPNNKKKNKAQHTSDSLIKDLLEKAKRGGELPPSYDDDDDEEGEAQGSGTNKNFFTGRGHRLGSTLDEVTEEVAEKPSSILEALQQNKPKRVTREITFWKEGFQVGPEGVLYRYDDPKNKFYLEELNQGRAPLKLLDVEFGQEVDVNVYRKLDESYKPPKRKLGGFHGQGQRLGDPIPGEEYSSATVDKQSESIADKESSTMTSSSSTSSGVTEKVEEKKGDTQIQIRLASGKREIYKCFSTDTVGTVYDYVKTKTEDKARPFTLNHAFPTKPIFDFNKTIKDEGLCNATVVQRWV